jgi:hypothetical protein
MLNFLFPLLLLQEINKATSIKNNLFTSVFLELVEMVPNARGFAQAWH